MPRRTVEELKQQIAELQAQKGAGAAADRVAGGVRGATAPAESSGLGLGDMALMGGMTLGPEAGRMGKAQLLRARNLWVSRQLEAAVAGGVDLGTVSKQILAEVRGDQKLQWLFHKMDDKAILGYVERVSEARDLAGLKTPGIVPGATTGVKLGSQTAPSAQAEARLEAEVSRNTARESGVAVPEPEPATGRSAVVPPPETGGAAKTRASTRASTRTGRMAGKRRGVSMPPKIGKGTFRPKGGKLPSASQYYEGTAPASLGGGVQGSPSTWRSSVVVPPGGVMSGGAVEGPMPLRGGRVVSAAGRVPKGAVGYTGAPVEEVAAPEVMEGGKFGLGSLAWLLPLVLLGKAALDAQKRGADAEVQKAQMTAQSVSQPSPQDIVQEALLQDVVARRQQQLGMAGADFLKQANMQQIMSQRAMRMQQLQQQLIPGETPIGNI